MIDIVFVAFFTSKYLKKSTIRLNWNNIKIIDQGKQTQNIVLKF